MTAKMHGFFYSIQFKIICITLVLFFCFAAVTTYFWYDELTEQATNSATNNLQSIMKVSNKNFETALKDLNSITALISSNLGQGLNTRIFNYLLSGESDDATILQYRRDAEAYISSLCNFKSYLNGLAVYDLKGNALSYGLVMPSNSIKSQPWYQSFFASEKDVLFLPPHYNDMRHTQKTNLVFSIVRPIRYRNETIGLVMADIKADLLNDMFNIDNLNEYALLIVDDSTKEVIFPTEKNNVDIAFLSSEKSSASSHYSFELYGQKYVAVTQKASLTDWTVVGLVPYNTILSDFIITRSKVLIIAFICAAVIILCILCFTTMVTHNLKVLAKEVSKIDREHLELDVCIQSKDESRLLYDQINFMLERMKELIHDIRNTERQKREYEIRALQAQINPHFLHNTLNTIEFLATIQGATNIKTASHALSDMLYVNLSGSKMITVEEEVKYLKNYLELQEYRFNGKFTAFFSVEENLYNCLLPKLLLQPLVENSLLHGIDSNCRPGIIQVQIFSQSEQLHIRIKDNGKGMAASSVEKILNTKDNSNSHHIGIANIRDRLSILFDSNQSFTIVSEPNLYTEIELCFPLIISESSSALYENNDCR